MSEKVDYMFKGIDLSPVMELLKNEDISGWFKNAEGGSCLRFLQSCFAEYCGTKYAFATSSGSTAIYTALRALGVGRGDRVLVPAYTHVGSVAPIVLAGAKPIFVDVDIHGNLDPLAIPTHVDAKALIAVHMIGMPCDIHEIKRRFGGLIIEDASHALGSEYKHRKCGSLADIGCFSIGGGRTKTIGAGEGGMVTVNDADIAQKCKNIRNHGDREAGADYLCFNFRMSELNALVALLQMPRLQMLLDWQMKNAERIIKELPSFLQVPKTPSYAKTTRYIIGCVIDKYGDRDKFLKKLIANKWEGGYPRKNIGGGWSKLIYDLTFYKKYFTKTLIMSEMLRDNAVWIDWHRFPRTDEEIDLMLKHIRESSP